MKSEPKNEKKNAMNYGTERVLEPKHVLPTSAWRVDNNRRIYPYEMRLDVKRIHLESTSFKEICLEANDNEQRIRQKILDIVIRRGKLHNPVTDTGGLLYGTVAEIGESYENRKGFKPGDEVLCNASLASIPLYIEKIIRIDRAFGQIEVEGHCIVSSGLPVIFRPQELPVNLLLFIFNESGTIYRICSEAVGKRRFLVVGNNLLTNLLFGIAIKKVAREDAEIVCLLDRKTEAVLTGGKINELMTQVFTDVIYVDILRPLECLEKIGGDSAFDLSVNCAGTQGAETINILATKSGGTVIFANMINNYNIALYITEAISRQLDIRCADGYLEAYDEFDLEIVRDLLPYIEGAEETTVLVSEDPKHHASLKSRMTKNPARGGTLMEDMVCESHAMSVVLNEVMTVSKYDSNVLITGESGSGKEKLAGLIHKNSNRNMQPFIKASCAAIHASQMEKAFFGTDQERGLLEQADNATLFLDEISLIPPEIQARLLRAVQDGEFLRVGGQEPVKVSVRIISATNQDIEDLIDAGLFRRDLYYLLNVVRIRVPALRDRTADIPLLIRHFLRANGERLGIKRSIADDAVEYLCQCEWPGNVRELESLVHRLMISARNQEIGLIDVMRELHADVFDKNVELGLEEALRAEEINMETMVENFEKNIIRHALEKYGSTRKAAKAIGISQTQLVRKKNKYGL